MCDRGPRGPRAVRGPVRHRRHASVAARAASTSSAWVSGLTFRITLTSVPSAAITKVDRSTPMYFLPYIDFSTQTP